MKMISATVDVFLVTGNNISLGGLQDKLKNAYKPPAVESLALVAALRLPSLTMMRWCQFCSVARWTLQR